MSVKPARRPVRALSVQEKLLAIDRVHEGESKAAVARDIGVPESTLRGWCKGEEKLRNSMARGGSPTLSPGSPKVPRLADTPLDYSSKEKEPTENRTMEINSQKERTPPLQYLTERTSALKPEALLYWMQQGQQTLPVSPLEGRTADTAGWFWKWYKNFGVLPQLTTTSPMEETQLSCEDDDPPETAGDAVKHGEKFLRWLECCSDPRVTASQILQFRYLLNNVKECAERERKKEVKVLVNKTSRKRK